jgi:hypothetical protein
MSQQPPDWWSRQRGPRLGCADVTIVSIASIVAFVVLIFVLLRPDFAKVIDVGGGGGNVTVASARATETPGSSSTTTASGGSTAPAASTTVKAATTPLKPTNTPVPAPPTITPVPQPTQRVASLKDSDGCRLRQDAGYDAIVIQLFGKGATFKLYNEQKIIGKDTWQKVEPNDGSNRVGWMLAACF